MHTKRLLDIAISLPALLILSPLLTLIAFLIWCGDGHSPWYRGVRIGRHGQSFRMLKFRSMRVDAWKTGVNSTSAGDPRITWAGRWLRRTKLDELPQFWNVLAGQMSLVGPRPQVPADAALYTNEEQGMLAVSPGITDLASIVFSDEGEILRGAANPDLLYNQIIRPWKSRMALLYVRNRSVLVDVKILALSSISLFSRPLALSRAGQLLEQWGADVLLCSVARRERALLPYPPPGASQVVSAYPDQAQQNQAQQKATSA